GIGQNEIGARLLAPMTTLPRLITVTTLTREVVIQGLGKACLDVGEQVRLVLLHVQEIVATPIDDLFGDLLLAPHGVNGDQSTFQIQQCQQSGNRGYFVRFLLDGNLSQAEVGLAGPGADEMEWTPTFGSIARVTEGLAIVGNMSQSKRLRQGLDP